ncbi:hypothetical protein GDO81_010754 [Engystomops pustulosus]|uniref:Reverse transcriptase domain-containing protein n=1 Tax=Engystomops pustulosus TaxID=76066 RepID=A0AAV7C2P6_ENGPU|nr:hypothetical protein GDO81_010754 [Engystomops pustulosus]
MGTRVAPSYANLFMGHFESQMVYNTNFWETHIVYYRRFIDDIFIIIKGTIEEAQTFVDSLNHNNWGINFTANIDQSKMVFLDLEITHQSKKIVTKNHFKKVDSNGSLKALEDLQEQSAHHYAQTPPNISRLPVMKSRSLWLFMLLLWVFLSATWGWMDSDGSRRLNSATGRLQLEAHRHIQLTRRQVQIIKLFKK